MSKVDVLDWDKKRVGEVELPDDVFAAPLREDILHSMVRWQLACRRQGTHQAKTRSEVSGGGKKPFKQKGTGNARQGSNRSPLMPGGAILFGPRPRDYSYSLAKRFKRLGLRSALSAVAKNGQLYVVSDMKSEGKTNELNKRLQGFGAAKALLIDGSPNAEMKRASRNLPNHKYFGVEGLNVFDLLKYDQVILTKTAVEKIVDRCRAE